MPYSKAQCSAFGAKADRGEDVPDDWKEQCSKEIIEDKGSMKWQDVEKEEEEQLPM